MPKTQRVQLNRWVLPETLYYLNTLAISRGFKQGPMMDRVIDEYKNPSLDYLLEKLIEAIPKEEYFTESEKKHLSKLKEIIGDIV